jgi:hypothetical protein
MSKFGSEILKFLYLKQSFKRMLFWENQFVLFNVKPIFKNTIVDSRFGNKHTAKKDG